MINLARNLKLIGIESFFSWIILLCQPGWGQATLVDEVNHPLNLKQSPRRIVSLAPNITEMIYALHAEDKLVGVTKYCDYPPEVKMKTSIGGMIDPSIETILSLRTELVIATADANKKENIEALARDGIESYTINPRNLTGLLTTIKNLGSLLERQNEAEMLIAGLQSRINRVKEKVSKINKPRVLLLVGTNPAFTTGASTYLNDFIVTAGGINVANSLPVNWPQVSVEQIISWAPEVIFLPASHTPGRGQLELNEISTWTSVPAVQKHQVFFLEAEKLLRTGPRLVDALEQASDLLIQSEKNSQNK